MARAKSRDSCSQSSASMLVTRISLGISLVLFLAVLVPSRIESFLSTDKDNEAATALPNIEGIVYHWAEFGIREHIFTGRWVNNIYRATVWVRILPTDQPDRLLARFVVTLNYAGNVNVDKAKYHAIIPKALLNNKTRLPSIYLQPATSSNPESRIFIDDFHWTPFVKGGWLNSALAGKAFLNSSTWYSLHMEGSEYSFPLHTFAHSTLHEIFKEKQVWLGLVESMMKKRNPAAFRFLLLQHLQYHLKLGFRGTILVCTPETAVELVANDTMRAEVEAKRLVLVAWEGALIRHYHLIMQVPANNLLKLAMAGSDSLLGLWDLDEFLVLPRHKPITYEVTEGCMKQVNDPKDYEQVITFSYAQDVSSPNPMLASWIEHGGMLQAIRHGKYTSRIYKHCNFGVLCKSIINPNADNQMHVHQLARPTRDEENRKPSSTDCAYMHHFFRLWVNRDFWDKGALGDEQLLKVEDLPPT